VPYAERERFGDERADRGDEGEKPRREGEEGIQGKHIWKESREGGRTRITSS
jgi:hypothetical protein